MAVYAAAVTSPMRKPQKVSESLYVYRGQVNLTNYNTTVAEITGITGKFRDDPTVVMSGVSESGYLCHWDPTDKGIKAFYPTNVSDQTPTADIVAAGGLEVANDVDVGLVYFVAFGFA